MRNLLWNRNKWDSLMNSWSDRVWVLQAINHQWTDERFNWLGSYIWKWYQKTSLGRMVRCWTSFWSFLKSICLGLITRIQRPAIRSSLWCFIEPWPSIDRAWDEMRSYKEELVVPRQGWRQLGLVEARHVIQSLSFGWSLGGPKRLVSTFVSHKSFEILCTSDNQCDGKKASSGWVG